jgi:hypothetical protein
VCLAFAAAALLAQAALAGFAGTDVFVPSVGRRPGNLGSQWYTLVWIHNPSATSANVTIAFLERNVPNPSPPVFNDSLSPGETRRYPNTVGTLFGVEKYGALHITANVPVLVTCRMYNLPPGGEDKDTQGQDHAAIPASFAIASGQSAKLLGVYQTSPRDDSQFRYNFGWVETVGGTADVRVIAYDEAGDVVGDKTYPTTGGYEPRYYPIEDLVPTVNHTDLTLEVQVVGGTGKIVAVGTGVANRSNDATTFEMSFLPNLLGGTGGLSTVSHDASLAGDGTGGSPLGIANGQVVRSLNGLHDGVTLAAGANVTLTPSGNTLTIATTGGSGGSGVSSVNGVTGAVTVAGSGGTTVSTAGNTVTVNTPTGGGTITGVTAGPGLAGGGTSGSVTISVVNGGITNGMLADTAVGTPKIADGAVIKGKLAASGGSAGQVLGTDGASLVWQTPAGGLTLPFQGTVSDSGSAIFLQNNGSGYGLEGRATGPGSSGIVGDTTNAGGWGVIGYSLATGNYGRLAGAVGVKGSNFVDGSSGVYGESVAATGYGVYGTVASDAAVAVSGVNTVNGNAGSLGGAHGVAGSTSVSTRSGVFGQSTVADGYGIYGTNGGNGNVGSLAGAHGVQGDTSVSSRSGVFGQSAVAGGFGVYGRNSSSGSYGYLGGGSYAGYFGGNVYATGDISAPSKHFKIDHPLDPADKYLYHTSVESPDMKTIYDGVVVTDETGLAVVQLPDWFQALNRDFRYQLTCIGRFAQAIVEQEIEGNRFTIRTNLAKVKVSWQVTGIRHDPYANAHRVPVEEDKPEAERGSYLHPQLYGQPEEKGIEWVIQPEMMQRMKAQREKAAQAKP